MSTFSKNVEEAVAVATESFTQLIDVMRQMVFNQTKQENAAVFQELGAEGMAMLLEVMFLARETSELSLSITHSALDSGFLEWDRGE